MTKRRANLLYAVSQAFYYAAQVAIFNFAAIYLGGLGCSDAMTGYILGIGNLLAILLQQGMASFINRTGFNTCRLTAIMFVFMAMLAASLLFLNPTGIWLGAVICAVITIQGGMQPFLNSLYLGYTLEGIEINYSRTRVFGSVAYSFCAFATGQLIAKIGSGYVPAMYMVPAAVVAVCLFLFKAPNAEVKPQKGAIQGRKESALRDHPHFAVFCLAIVFLVFSHIFVDTYMIRIMERVGGTDADVGLALAIAGIIEIPSMFLFDKISGRFGNHRVLAFSCWMWSAKVIFVMLAPTRTLVYAAVLLHFASYALYIPASVKHIALTLPQSLFLKGQALLGSAFTGGCLVSTAIGGTLLDTVGVDGAMLVMMAATLTGAALMTVSVKMSRKEAR